MDKLSREKFHDIKTGDRLTYIDSTGCRCIGDVVGWINHEGLPAALCGQHGDKIVPLARVLSRSRAGCARKEWKL